MEMLDCILRASKKGVEEGLESRKACLEEWRGKRVVRLESWLYM